MNIFIHAGQIFKVFKHSVVVCLTVVAVSTAAYAQNLDTNSFFQRESIALAAGNAYGPLATHGDAIYYNPAGLTLGRYLFFVDAGISISASRDSVRFLEDSRNILGKDNVSDSDLTDYFNRYLGNEQRYAGSISRRAGARIPFAGLTIGGAQFYSQEIRLSFVDKGDSGFVIDPLNPPNPGELDTLEIYSGILDSKIMSLGYRHSDEWRWGFNYKNQKFTIVDNKLDFIDAVAGSKIDLSIEPKEYKGNGIDVGLINRKSAFFFGALQTSFTANNFGGVTLKSTGGDGGRYKAPGTFNVGSALLVDALFADASVSIELEDITSAIEQDGAKRSFGQRTRFGVAAGIIPLPFGGNLINLGIGRYQGVATNGVEINLFTIIRLGYSNWGFDSGNKNNRKPHKEKTYKASIGLSL